MNYIKQLQCERLELATKVAKMSLEINEFIHFLRSSKFQNDDSALRKDWISTTDVILRLQEIKNIV